MIHRFTHILIYFFGKRYTIFSVIIVNIISILAGASLSWTSPVIPKLKELNDENPLGRLITKTEESLINSLYCIGGIFGPFMYGFLMSKYGRKVTFYFLNLAFCVAYVMLTFSTTVELYYVARIFVGMALGGSFSYSAMYIGEMVEDENRGSYASLCTSFILTGILFSYSLGPYVTVMHFNLVLLIISIVYFPLFWISCVESPYWLVEKKKYMEAEECLAALRHTSSSNVHVELENIKEFVDKSEKGSFSDIFSTIQGQKAFFIVTVLLVIQQFSGINVIITNAQTIFNDAGSSLSAELSSIVVGCVQVGTCLITPIASRYVGKKKLLLVATAGVCIGDLLMGIYFVLPSDNSVHWLPIFAMVFYICLYNCGFASLPWVLTGELYPTNVKAIGPATSTAMYWLFGFLLTYFFEDLNNAITLGGTFFFYGGFCVLGLIFIWFFVFETKGKSFQEIQIILGQSQQSQVF